MRARAKRRKGLLSIHRQGSEVAQPPQPHLARRDVGLLFLVSVVGHEGRQTLGPVAARVVDQHAIAPPVVQHLMAERSGTDERQAQHLLTQVSERGHAKAGGQGAGNHRELGEGIGANACAVTRDVARTVVQVSLSQARLGIERRRKISAQAQRLGTHALDAMLTHDPRPGHEVNAIGSMVEFKARPIVARKHPRC